MGMVSELRIGRGGILKTVFSLNVKEESLILIIQYYLKSLRLAVFLPLQASLLRPIHNKISFNRSLIVRSSFHNVSDCELN